MSSGKAPRGILGAMRMLVVLTALLSLNASPVVAATPPQARPPAIGERAPGFTLRDQNGVRVSLGAQKGKKVVLVFYRGYW
jgi:cytochrome oxidase Cu insertion factor (SCO1/SenC/PrrC family)